MQPALKKDSDNRIDILNAWSDKYSTVPVRSFSLSKMEQRELLNRSINNQIENTFAVEKKHLYPGMFIRQQFILWASRQGLFSGSVRSLSDHGGSTKGICK